MKKTKITKVKESGASVVPNTWHALIAHDVINGVKSWTTQMSIDSFRVVSMGHGNFVVQARREDTLITIIGTYSREAEQ